MRDHHAKKVSIVFQFSCEKMKSVIHLKVFMRRLAISLLILTLVVCPSIASPSAFEPRVSDARSAIHRLQTAYPAQRKRALLIGVSSYCRGTDALQCVAGGKYWWDLNSESDVSALESVLKSKFNFDEVRILKTREETTRRNITEVFRSFLIGRTQKGDIAYFHFSGHGAQVPDDEKHGPNLDIGDEIDGLDESLVPSDYISQSNGSNNLRDDEISRLLVELRARGPASVTVTMDSCFSGSNTRGGNSLVRGRGWDGTPPAQTRRSLPSEGPSGLLSAGEARAHGLTILSATRNDQLAFETKDPITHRRMGAFTYALVRSLENADAYSTYRDLISIITEVVTTSHRTQEPQLEGDKDLLLMSGVFVQPPRPYLDTQLRGENIFLSAGGLHGVTEGSLYSLYVPGGAPNKIVPLADAQVETVHLTTAALKLKPPQTSNKPSEFLRGARAIETMHNFGDIRLKVSVHDMLTNEAGREVLAKLRESEIVNIISDDVSGWDLRLCRNNCPDETKVPSEPTIKFTSGFTLQRSDGSVSVRVGDNASTFESLRLTLEREARWRFIKELSRYNDPDVRIKMRLIPVADVEVSSPTGLAFKVRRLPPEVIRSVGEQVVLREGDFIMLEIMNLGTEDVWVSVLDINSEGGINPLWPHPEIPVGLSGENRIPAARQGNPVWTLIPLPFVIEITKPYGLETFKAIATLNKTDFSPLFQAEISDSLQTGEKRGRSELQSALGQALVTAITGRGVRGGVDRGRIMVPPGWGTASVTFMVKPKD